MKTASIFGRRPFTIVFFLALFLAPPAAIAGITEFFSATGKLSLSVDGAGSFTGGATAHIIQVEKPSASATIRKAFVMAAGPCGANSIPDNSVSINGNPIAWTDSAINSFLFSVRADVTSIVKSTIDSAAAGRINFTFAENTTDSGGCIDGEVLVVAFDDPTQTRDTTIILLFGGQALGGDNFAITLAEPIDPSAPGALADMGLGISFSAQDQPPTLAGSHLCGTASGQASTVDVNGQRLTSCAGNVDDGVGTVSSGNLITVGGLDDTNDNPGDPFQRPADGQTPRVNDDELYSLLPFITAENRSIEVFTLNASRDDNIFFAYFHLSGAAIVGEGIVLSPISASNPVGTDHTVTAKVTDAHGDPVSGVLVTFDVISGPNQGAHGTDTTDANGEATFTYTDNGGAGTDQIQASFVDSNEDTKTSNTVTKEWTTSEANTPPVADPQSVTTPEDTPKLITLTGGDADGDALTFQIVSSPQHGDLSQLSAATASQKSKAKRQKQKKQKQRGKPMVGTMASTLTPRALAVLVQSTAANNVTYTPDPNYNGPDSFTFKVNDGKADSAPATVSITVTATPDIPEIRNLTFERRPASTPGYLTPGIAALLDFRDPDGGAVRLDVTVIRARNVPKPTGCGNLLPSDDVTIQPFFENVLDPDADPNDFERAEIKAIEIGPTALNAATAQGCQVTLEMLEFTVHPAGNDANELSGSFSIDSDVSTTATASRQSRSSSAAKQTKMAAPVVR